MLALPMLEAGTSLREAVLADVRDLADVRIASWRHAYRRILPADELRRMTRVANRAKFRRALTQRRPTERVWVATQAGRVVGYAMGGLQPDRRLPFRGEIFELYLHPEVQGRGVGRSLLARSLWALAEHGLHPVMLWVLAQNSARHFYASCGGTIAGRSTVVVAGKRLPRIAYGWSDALPLPALTPPWDGSSP